VRRSIPNWTKEALLAIEETPIYSNLDIFNVNILFA
jgi:hypothetical protein